MTASLSRGGFTGPMADLDLADRRILATHKDYSSAQQTVDTLSDRGFEVNAVTIVGSDLVVVESVTGRLTTARAAGAGAASGAWFGLFLGLIFGIATPYFLVPLLWGLFLGAAFGAVFGAMGHAAYRGRRDFASARTIIAQRYDVLVTADHFARAAQVLGLPPTTATGVDLTAPEPSSSP